MKTTLLMLSLWASIAVGFAQSQGFNTTLEASDYAFAPLDKSYVTSKILYDRVFHNADLQFFNTQTDTSSAQHYLQAYYELYLSNYNNSQVLTPQDIDDLIWTTQQYPAVQIGVLLAKFHRINYNVIESDSEGQYHLNNNYTYDDLYIEQDVNVVSILQSKIYTGVNFFQLPDWGIFSNRNVYPTSISIDFGDGLPIQTIRPGVEPVSANYTTSGEKIINFTVNLNNGTQFTAKSKVYVIGGANPTPISNEFAKIAKIKQVQSPPFPYNDGISLVDSIRIQASIPFQGYNESSASKGVADVLTYYAAGRTTLQKPIVILDGFDPNDQNKGGYLYRQRLSYERNGIPAQLGNELRANASLNGYDIVVVNFPQYAFQSPFINYCNLYDPILGTCLQQRTVFLHRTRVGGTDYVERNARVMVKILDSLNTKLQNNGSSEKLMMIGPSMGGLISRLAIRYMEQNNINHNLKLWVSFDSPHLGANIPIGFQQMVKFFAEKLNLKDAVDGLSSLSSPAAKQMLLDHYLKNTSTDPEIVAGAEGYRSVFAQTLADAGFPQASCLRKVALNNGAKNGFTTFSTCTEGVHVRARFTNTALVVCKAVGLGLCALNPIGCVVGGLLNVGCVVGRNRILDAKVFTTPSNTDRCKIFESAIAGFGLSNYTYYSKGQGNDRMGLDVVPAGTYDVFEAITGAIPTKLTWKILKEDKLNFFVRTLADKSFDATSFIPSVSSYAMLNSNRNWGNSLENVNVPTETPFDAIYAPTNENQEHVTVTEAGVDFLYQQIALSNNCSSGGNCPQNLILTNTITNQTSTQQASESITANNQIINANVTYKAGQNINLNEGFIADSQTGTVFRAFIQGCISWQSSNIGSGSGSSSTSNNTLTINGNGSLGGSSDNIHFYHTPASTDVSIIARINAMNPNNGERAGIMIRTNTNDNSPFYEFIIDGNGNVGKLKRKNTSDNADFVGFAPCPTSGSWIRLDKIGNIIKCYIKTDDSASWAEVVGFDDHNDNNLGSSFEIGFVAYAGASATFSNITINGNPIN